MNNNSYKQTEIGLIPSDWEVKKLGEIAKIKHGKDQKKIEDKNGIYPILGTGGIIGKTNNFLYDKPSVLIGRKGTIDKPRFMDTPFWTVDTLFYTELSENIIPKWLFNVFHTIDWYFYNEASGVPSLSGSTISAIKLAIPSRPEQQKIAKILTIWDDGIIKIKSIITELKQRKKSLAIELLSGRLRLINDRQPNILIKNRGFTIPKDWKVSPLSKVLKQIKKSVSPEPQKLYKQIGIRSHAKGIFYKEEVTGLSLGNKSVFQIEPDCFIVNIVFAWEHAIARTTINEAGMIASHRFPMYKTVNEELDLDYLLHFFKSQKGKDLLVLASPGGAGRNKTLGQSEFQKLQIPIPSITEQKRIAAMLDKVDEEISLYQDKLLAFQTQKKGLMQQLLTGKTRVNVNH